MDGRGPRTGSKRGEGLFDSGGRFRGVFRDNREAGKGQAAGKRRHGTISTHVRRFRRGGGAGSWRHPP